MKLTSQNFFSHLIFHPFDTSKKSDQAIALVASIACGIFSLGICHAVCAIRQCVKHRPSHQTNAQDRKISEVKNSTLKTGEMNALKNQTVEKGQNDLTSNLLQSITPLNIDDLLNVQESGWCRHVKKNMFSMERHESTELKLGDEMIIEGGQIWYSCSFESEEGKGWINAELEVENGKFKLFENGTQDTYHYFDNFEQFLKHLMKGNFYQGNHFKADYYILRKKDNSEIRYENSN